MRFARTILAIAAIAALAIAAPAQAAVPIVALAAKKPAKPVQPTKSAQPAKPTVASPAPSATSPDCCEVGTAPKPGEACPACQAKAAKEGKKAVICDACKAKAATAQAACPDCQAKAAKKGKKAVICDACKAKAATAQAACPDCQAKAAKEGKKAVICDACKAKAATAQAACPDCQAGGKTGDACDAKAGGKTGDACDAKAKQDAPKAACPECQAAGKKACDGEDGAKGHGKKGKMDRFGPGHFGKAGQNNRWKWSGKAMMRGKMAHPRFKGHEVRYMPAPPASANSYVILGGERFAQLNPWLSVGGQMNWGLQLNNAAGAGHWVVPYGGIVPRIGHQLGPIRADLGALLGVGGMVRSANIGLANDVLQGRVMWVVEPRVEIGWRGEHLGMGLVGAYNLNPNMADFGGFSGGLRMTWKKGPF